MSGTDDGTATPGSAGPAGPGVGEFADVLTTGRTAPTSRDAEFTAFMAEHADDLRRTAWLLVGDVHRAEELAQEALARTYASWGRARDGEPLAYARRVLVNLRIDTWRRHRREVLTSPDRLPDEAVPGTAPQARADDRDQLARALALLNPKQRRVVVLRHLVGLSEAEVAADLGISVGTVKSNASRALALLRAELRTEGGSR
jgi:RNA polymerase sigma-70 factor (sigma-E family)